MTITTEEAERLAVRLETKSWRHGYPNDFYPEPFGGVFINGVFRGNTAAALRSLAAERDAAMQWRAAIDAAHTKWRMPIEDNPTDALQRLLEVEVNAKREALQAHVAELKAALREMIYETTHLSPQEDDGSHWCKISKHTLEKARTALEGKKA